MKKAKILLAILLIGLLLLGGCGQKAEPDSIDDNYRTFYQIFVGSFSDANGDGIGDLRGVINRLDYLNDGNIHSKTSLGVQGIWLSPIFSSPSYHKYDARDYYKIDWRFGEEKDLVELLELCHARNVKVILDLAINHTSSEHEWFLKFKEARMNGDTESQYYDYYTCATSETKKSGIRYQKIAGVDCWYECNFDSAMPELNFDNPAVREEALRVAKYYLDLGIDGFRFDAVKYIYYGDTARSVAFWEWYMDELRQIKPDIYCVGECWSGDSEILTYASALNCFNFAMSQAEGVVAYAAKGLSVSNFTGYIESFQKKLSDANPDGMMMPFLSNHDMDRIAGAFVTENNMRMAANLYLLSPGSPTVYYGEEIGLRGSRGGANTDANRRLAMPWGDEDTIKDPIGATYPADKQIKSTVSEQLTDENSLLCYYRRLLDIRHGYPAIARGTYQAVDGGSGKLGGFVIAYEGNELLLLHNISAEAITVDLAALSDLDGHSFKKLCEVIGVGDAALKKTTLTVGPMTSVLLG